MRAVLTEGAEREHLFRLGWPMMIGIFAVVGFNVVDTFFIAQLGGAELAAISYTFPIVTLMASIALGLGAGLGSLVSRSLGSGKHQLTYAYATDGLSLSFVIVAVLTAIGLFTIRPVFSLMGAEPETIPLIEDYMQIWYLNMVFVVVPMVGNSAIRATGNVRFPAAVMIFAGVVNAILDPILIFGLLGAPRMELQGAALATLISRMLTLVAALYVLHYKKRMLLNPFRELNEVLANWGKIIKLGAVNALNNIIVPLSAFVMTIFVSTFGEQAVAAFGIGTRIEALVLIPIIALAAALAPFSGQNWGAKKYHRIYGALTEAKKFAVLWTVALAVIFFFSLKLILSWFTEDSYVQSVAHSYILWVLPSFIPLAALLYMNTVYSATGRPIISLTYTCIRVLVLLIPFAWMLKGLLGVEGVFIGVASANVLSGLLSYIVFKKSWSKRRQTASSNAGSV